MVPPAPPPPPQYKNTGSFKNRGFEFSLEYSPMQDLKIQTNYSYIHMDVPLPATPGHNLFFSGAYRLKKFHFTLKLQNIFDLYNETGQGVEIIEDAYNVLGARVGYQASKSVSIYISGHNLGNQDYQVNYGYPMPGRTLFAGINLKLTGGDK
jgi:iron complex outermembrane receptor protein